MRRTNAPSYAVSRSDYVLWPACRSGKLGLRRFALLAGHDYRGFAFDVVLRTLEHARRKRSDLYHRCENRYGGRNQSKTKRLKELKRENARPDEIVTEQPLDIIGASGRR